MLLSFWKKTMVSDLDPHRIGIFGIPGSVYAFLRPRFRIWISSLNRIQSLLLFFSRKSTNFWQKIKPWIRTLIWIHKYFKSGSGWDSLIFKTSVSDPYWSQYGSGSSILGQYGSGSGFGSRYFCDQNERKKCSEIFSFLFQLLIALIHWLRTSGLKSKPLGPQKNGQCSY